MTLVSAAVIQNNYIEVEDERMQNWSGVDQNNIIIGLWITDIKTTKTGTGNPLKDLQYVYATGK